MAVQAKRYPLPLAQPGIAALVPCGHGPGCPLGVDAPAIARALRAGDHRRAYLLARGPNPFASTCGHGCHAPCESACRRRALGAPVAIAALEAHAAAFDIPQLLPAPGPCTSAHDIRSVAGAVGRDPIQAVQAPRSGKRVAIVGAGPAGLACAHDLTLLGHSAIVFDAAAEPGGLLTHALPTFRFPVASARTESTAILALGIEFRGRSRVAGAAGVRALLADGFDAVFLAIGASTPAEPAFPNQPPHLDVIDALHALTADLPGHGRTVIVGDGDLAVDAARVSARRAVRDGAPPASVQLVLTQPLDATAADPALLAAALAEGIGLHAGWSATRYVTDAHGALTGVELARAGERTAMVLPCDRLLTAGPRAPDGTSLGRELAQDARGCIAVDPDTLATSMDRVWAGGACAFGHRSIAHATADGKRAAWQIHAALTGHRVQIRVTSAWVEVDDWDGEHGSTAPRLDTSHLPPPADPFAGGSLRTADELRHEGSRCFDCTMLPVVDERCTTCGACVPACPPGALSILPGPPKQLRLDQDRCTRCGNCVNRCPEGAIAIVRAVWEERLTTDLEGPPRPPPPPPRPRSPQRAATGTGTRQS